MKHSGYLPYGVVLTATSSSPCTHVHMCMCLYVRVSKSSKKFSQQACKDYYYHYSYDYCAALVQSVKYHLYLPNRPFYCMCIQFSNCMQVQANRVAGGANRVYCQLKNRSSEEIFKIHFNK